MRTFLLFVFILNAGFLKAQEVLTYKDAVKTALENNTNLLKTKNQLAVNQAMKIQGLAQFGPSLTASGGAGIITGNNFVEQEGKTYNTTARGLSGRIDAGLVLFGGFYNINYLKQANLALDAQEMLIQRTQQDIINNVTANYLTVLLDQELVKIAEENYQNQEALTNQIRGFVEVGQRAIVEQYTQEAELKRLETEVLKANRNLRNDKANLALTMSVNPLSEFKLVDPGIDVNSINLNNLNLDSLVTTAMANRPDLVSFRRTAEASAKSISMARSQMYPFLSAFASTSSAWNDVVDRSFNNQFLTDNLKKSVGLSLTIPIFSRMRYHTQVVQAKVTLQNAQVDLMFKELQIKSEVYNIYRNFQDYVNSYQVSLAQKEAAELALRTQRESYDLGIATQVELNEATRRFVEAETNLASNKYRIIFQRILIDYAIGVLTFNSLP